MNKKAARVKRTVNTSGKNVLLSDNVNGLNAKHNKITNRIMSFTLNDFKILSNTIIIAISPAIDMNLKIVNENPNSLDRLIPAMN